MPVIAMTGATGFVGRRVLEQLLPTSGSAKVRLLARLPERVPRPVRLHPGVSVIRGDLTDPGQLDALVRDAAVVIHAAAAIAGISPADFDRTNIVGTRYLLEAMRRSAPDAHLIHVSSLAAREPQLSWYASSKRAAEELVLSRWKTCSIIRPPAVYGPEDPALATFWTWLARGWLIRLGPAHARFSLLHVDDLAALIVALSASGPQTGPLEVAGPEPEHGWSWPALASTASAVAGRRVRTVGIPAPLLRIAGRTSPLWARLINKPALLNPGKVRELHHPDWTCDKLSAPRGWRATITLERALPELPGWSKR
ncbi:MAG: NAD-dependent epimerase/dehydratase family protein [Wenzhouxiangellaceae bacterium]